MREQKPDLYDENVNGWLAGDDRRFLLRCLRGENGKGAARAFLSDGYKIIDNLDVLLAALDGVRQAGMPVRVDGCDLTQRRMYVRIVCEQVQALAPALLAGYRSPFTGAAGADNPVVFSGFMITNSETGCGAFSLVPRLVVQVCDNGMTITKDAMRAVHLGERLDEGVVTWSGNTLDKTLALITAKTTDAVTAFLDPGYVERTVREMEKDAGHPVEDPQETIRTVSAAAAVHRHSAGQHPEPLHPRRRRDRRRGHARGDQRRPDPRRRRHRLRDGVPGAAFPRTRRRALTTPTPVAPLLLRRGATAVCALGGCHDRPLYYAAPPDRLLSLQRHRSAERHPRAPDQHRPW